MILLLFIFIVFKNQQSKKKVSAVFAYSVKILSFFALLINTILAFPLMSVFLSAIFCFENDNIHGNLTCYDGIYFLHLIIGVLGLLLFLIFSIMFILLFADLNPWSTVPFASPQSRLPLIRLVLKLILVLYFTLDFHVSEWSIISIITVAY